MASVRNRNQKIDETPSLNHCLITNLRSSTVSHKREVIYRRTGKVRIPCRHSDDVCLSSQNLKRKKECVCVYAWGRLHTLETPKYCCLLVWIQHIEIYTCTHWVNSAQMPYYRGICVQWNLLKHKHLTALTSPKQHTNGFSKHHFEMWFSNRLDFTAWNNTDGGLENTKRFKTTLTLRSLPELNCAL